MNELQKAEFQLLELFVDVCKGLKLNYYLVCGSALGAVKYKGFIPWDDDIDVALPRPDYERFIREAHSFLPEHVFLQNFHTEPKLPCIYSKLRNSNTTYIEKSASKLKINHGVFIDIFPLDGYPKTKFKQKAFEIKKKLYTNFLGTAYLEPKELKSKIIYKIKLLFGIDKRILKYTQKYDKLVKKYDISDSELLCNHCNWQGRLEYAPKSQYGGAALAEFEGLTVRIPEQYHEYLSQKYGNYMADLPVDERCGHHYCTVCDLSKSYKEYIE